MTIHGLSCIQVEVVFVRSKYKQHIPGALYSAYFESCSLKSKVNTSPSESEDERKTYMIVSVGHRLDGLIVIIIGLGLGLCGYLCGGASSLPSLSLKPSIALRVARESSSESSARALRLTPALAGMLEDISAASSARWDGRITRVVWRTLATIVAGAWLPEEEGVGASSSGKGSDSSSS
jgi:hypothetical protein